MPKYLKYRTFLVESLREQKEAKAYLEAALEENDPEFFLLAIKDVIEARGGIGKFAQMSGLNRQNLYQMLSKQGNPELKSLWNLLDSLGMRLSISSRGVPEQGLMTAEKKGPRYASKPRKL